MIKPMERFRSHLEAPAGQGASIGPILAVWLVLFACITIGQSTLFWYDANGYWEHGKKIFSGGGIHLLRYDFPLRGYAFPFIMGIIGRFAELTRIGEASCFRVASATAAAIILVHFLPRFIRTFFEVHLTNRTIYAFAALLVIFWRGLLASPLTDFFALTGLCYSFYALRQEAESRWFLAGAAFAFTLLTRPVFYISIPFFAYFLMRRLISARFRVRNASFFFLGMTMLFVPQLFINLKLYGVASVLPQPRLFFAGGKSFYWSNVTLGFWVQKYETYVGKEYGQATALAVDLNGRAMLERAGVREILDAKGWLSIVLSDPVAYAGVILRHVLNGLDAVYPDVYLESLTRSVVRSFLNYSIWFAVFWSFARGPRLIGRLRDNGALLGALFLPTFAALPNHVETRFYLFWHLAAYLYVGHGLLKFGSRWSQRTVLAGMVFVGVCFYLSVQVSSMIPDASIRWRFWF